MYRDERQSNRPDGIHLVVPEKTEAAFEDVVLAFVSVERGDSRSDLGLATRTIAELVDHNRARNGCVVMPFAHLSRRLAKPDAARELLEALAKGLEARLDCQVVLASFGFHKLLELSMVNLGHPGSVAYREI